MRLDVIAAGMRENDGVTYDALCLAEALRTLGVEADVFTDHAATSPAMQRLVEHYEVLTRRSARPDAVIYSYSTASPITAWLQQLGIPVILRYQNITPAEYFESFDPRLAAHLRRARDELAPLAARAVASISPSRFNAAEVEAHGITRSFVLPNFCRLLRPLEPPAEPYPLMLLFVGRLVPNKCQHYLVQVAGELARRAPEEVRLRLHGNPADCPTYSTLVRSMAAQVSAKVHFSVEADDMATIYAGAHYYLSLSEHEGFGMPLVEAMAAGVPVLARSAAAVAETVGMGGIVFESHTPADIADLVLAIHSERERWQQLRNAGLQRAAYFRHDRLREQLRGILRELGVLP